LARSFRYYEKKRGTRRTGSPTVASVGEAVFFAAFLLLGCGGVALLFTTLVVPEWRVNNEFVETSCKVLEKKIGEKQGEDGPLYRPEIKIEYNAGGEISTWTNYDIHKAYSNSRENSLVIIDRFDVYSPERDNRYPCWYDPTNPCVAVLVRGYRWWVWLPFTVPISFIFIGAGGLIYALLHRGKSAERRAAMNRRGGDRDPFRVGGRDDRRYPSVPQGVNITNSPGTRLKFRLPMARSPGWALFGTLMFCVFWNGIVSVFVVIAVSSHLAGRPEWFLTFFIIPFVLIGLGAIGVFLRQLLVTTGIGPTFMEISDHPLYPGDRCRALLSQSGRLTINAMHVSLTCEEVATYRQGTNTRTETRKVYCREVFRRESFEIQSGLPFEADFELDLPEGVMHSFKADHNEVNWTLVVEGDVDGWPDYRRAFPVIIRPTSGEPRR